MREDFICYYSTMQHEILEQLNTRNAVLLGEGIEACVYQLPESKVVRIYKNKAAYKQVKKMQDFYDSLNISAVAFSLPKILSIHEYNDTVYTIDNQLTGTPLRLQLTSGNKQTLLKSYIHITEEEIASLHVPYSYFGEILANKPLRCSTWPAFLQTKTQQAYKSAAMLFDADVPEIKHILEFFTAESNLVDDVTQARLVHGDFNASNVLFNNGIITAVTDFGELTIAGDPRMDIASGIIGFMEEEDGMRKSDGDFLLSYLISKYGPSTRRVIHLYRLYYAIVFASYCKEGDPRTYAWCLRTFKEHLTNSYIY